MLRQPAADTEPVGRELMAYVAERVAPHEKIRRVEFATGIPKSPSGKILRRLLAGRDQAATPRAAAGADRAATMISLAHRRPRPLAAPRRTRRAAGRNGERDHRRRPGHRTGAGPGTGRCGRGRRPDRPVRYELAETIRLVEASGGTTAAARADVTDQQAVAAAIDTLRRQLGPVDLLVNNAGVSGPFGDAWQVDPEDWWRAVEINLRGVFLCSRAVLPGMTARGAGRIVNITSEAGAFRWPQVSAYSVSKAAVIKFTENLAAEASRSGVRAFSVHPGLTPIGLSERALAGAAPPGSAEARTYAWVRGELRPAAAPSPRWWPDSSPGSPQATRTRSAAATYLSTMTWTPSWPAVKESGIVISSGWLAPGRCAQPAGAHG